METFRYKIILEYDGANYRGWQAQKNAPSIQESVRTAAQKFLGEPADIQGAGRTDAGVHARAMVVAFQTTSRVPLRAFVDGTNRFLPPDIAVQHAQEVDNGFRPIADALFKHYRYTIYNAPIRSPLRRLYSWHVREALDVAQMAAAAHCFVGRHDFGAFRAANCATKTTIRRMDAVTVSQQGRLIIIDVTGEGFLKNMVRIMTGTLVDVGRGRFEPGHVGWLLQNPDRKKAGVTAPACGLCLIDVQYATTEPAAP